ncbi:MAG: hypothetical protein MK052_03675 [Alphaproteobacteria bacterium]|nr:hypothetical protein [Alphaproteobacteria bacterium]
MKNLPITTTAKLIGMASVIGLLSACGGGKSTTITELTKYDKHMNCSELQMEITEATFLRDKAERNRGLSFKNVVMPLSYPSTYLNSANTMESAGNRIDYLSRLSDIKGCNAQGQYAAAEMQFEPMGYGQQMGSVAAPSTGAYREMHYPSQAAASAPARTPQYQAYQTSQHYARPSYGY